MAGPDDEGMDRSILTVDDLRRSPFEWSDRAWLPGPLRSVNPERL